MTKSEREQLEAIVESIRQFVETIEFTNPRISEQILEFAEQLESLLS